MKKQSPEEKLEAIRHSLSHLMTMAVLELYPKTGLGVGTPIENGFYQDYDLPEKISEDILPKLEKRMKELIKEKIDFVQTKVSFADALKFYKNDPYKTELVKAVKKKGEKTASFFDSGNFHNLCKGPHVKNTKEIDLEAFKLSKIAGAYWRGDEKNKMLTRIYGVAFNTKKELDEYLKMLEAAEKCDHRTLGERLGIFMIDEEIGKGLPLLLPNGYFVRRQLENYMYELEQKNGYEHVLTPVLAKEDLYKKSGHLAHYKGDMYAPIKIENEIYYLKPMNCPHHHSIYKHHKRSYRELPFRLAEFGHVHRYERSGTLSGLIRVRGFTQNDAHIYTDEENLEKEIINVIKLAEKVYATFGIKDYWYRLSLPDFKNKEKFGDVKNKKQWERSSEFLRKALKDSGHKFIEAIGEATFYGPKIDIQIRDVWGREDSIGTIQVDYYSAPRFNLSYVDKDGKEKPIIIIHRAIMGAFERFLAFFIEKTCGALPLWLSPVQAEIVNIGSDHHAYAKNLCKELITGGIKVKLNDDNLTVSKRIREAEIKKIPYILVVGDKEVKNKTVNVRHYRRGQEGEIKIEKLIEKIKKEIENKVI